MDSFLYITCKNKKQQNIYKCIYDNLIPLLKKIVNDLESEKIVLEYNYFVIRTYINSIITWNYEYLSMIIEDIEEHIKNNSNDELIQLLTDNMIPREHISKYFDELHDVLKKLVDIYVS